MSRETQTTPNLRTVADRVGLAPCSVSSVLNNAPAARAIPQATKDRIFQAAAELNYRPNLWARSLRTKRTRMVAVVAPDFGLPTAARVVAAAQERLHREGYLLVLARLDSADSTPAQTYFQQRGIEGVIAIDSTISRIPELPTAAIDLTALTYSTTSDDSAESWLSALGRSAADSVISQIESKTPVEPKRAEPKRPATYLGSASMHRLGGDEGMQNHFATYGD
ncbi:MAG: LacI family DNA-binding transcriptional regulator [Candidatus Sulfotelmatobacter sp.]